MLNAVGQKKAKIEDASDAKKHPKEDIITSSVFGPLVYFGAEASVFLNSLMREAGFAEEPFFKNGSFLDFKFWPRWGVVKSTERTNSIEPDLMITGKQGDDKRILIIEVKWGAKLETDQLKDQWNAAQKKYTPKHTDIWHLLLVRTRKTDDDEQLHTHPVCKQAKVVTWHDVSKITALPKFGGDATETPELRSWTPGLRSWAEDVHAFLKILGVASQSGWKRVGLQDVSPLPDRDCKLLAFLPEYQVGWASREIRDLDIKGSRKGAPIVKSEQGQAGWSDRLY